MTTDTRQPVLYFGTCRSCGVGLVLPRRCGTCGSVILHCAECDAAWIAAPPTVPPLHLTGETVACPRCDGDLYGSGSRLATIDDVAKCEWIVAAVADGSWRLFVDGW